MAATGAGLLFAALVMRAPPEDVGQLALILVASGAVSLIAGGALVRWSGTRRHGLRLRLAALYGAGLVVMAINVLGAARLMFLSAHDLWLLLLLLGFAAALSLLLGSAGAGRLVADLGQLATLAERLAQGDLRARAGLAGQDEVAQLAGALDQMAAQLQASIERERAQELARREMVAAVSHDLRTPLTTIRAMIEAVTDGVVAEPADVQRYLTLIRGEVQHLSVLIDDLFELSQIESGALRLDLSPTSVPELVAQTVETFEAPAREAGVALEHAGDPGIPPVRADAARLVRVLRNLLDNALRYTPAGGKVQVEARLEGRNGGPAAVRVSIRDTGPGLPEGDVERVFERFYRGTRARARTDGGAGAPGARRAPATGAGLGLTIARGLVQAHGGRLWAERSPEAQPAGAVFHFTLPLGGTS